MVRVRWLGHACFAIYGKDVVVVTDPHNGEDLGIRPPDVKADIVLISHGHYDHYNGLELVSKPDTKVIDSEEGEWEVKGVKIIGVRAYHDKSYGEIRGENYIYYFVIDGVSFCHLGDLGHILEEEQLKVLKDKEIDVLMIPVGGVFTIDHNEAKTVVEQLNPRIVIPMHYKIPKLRLPIKDEKPFVKLFKNVEMLNTDSFDVSRESLPQEMKVVVLTYKG
ncbi:MAG: MBL fold metallo-hydrolase [Thermoprotei archaeon]|nr:MBL fold metallo-hydrolase [Thermoprotei archaeon]